MQQLDLSVVVNHNTVKWFSIIIVIEYFLISVYNFCFTFEHWKKLELCIRKVKSGGKGKWALEQYAPRTTKKNDLRQLMKHETKKKKTFLQELNHKTTVVR